MKQYQPSDNFYLERGIRKAYHPGLNTLLAAYQRRQKIERDAALVELVEEHFANPHYWHRRTYKTCILRKPSWVVEYNQRLQAGWDRQIQRNASARDYYAPAWVLNLPAYSGANPQYPDATLTLGAKDGSHPRKLKTKPVEIPVYHRVAGPHRFYRMAVGARELPGPKEESDKLPALSKKEAAKLGVVKSPNWKRRKANGLHYNPFPKPVPVPSKQTPADANDKPVTTKWTRPIGGTRWSIGWASEWLTGQPLDFTQEVVVEVSCTEALAQVEAEAPGEGQLFLPVYHLDPDYAHRKVEPAPRLTFARPKVPAWTAPTVARVCRVTLCPCHYDPAYGAAVAKAAPSVTLPIGSPQRSRSNTRQSGPPFRLPENSCRYRAVGS